MFKKRLCFAGFLIFFVLSSASAGDETVDSLRMLREVVITSSNKKGAAAEQMQPAAVSQFGLKQIEQERIETVKDLSALVPNYYIPDYGSKMTASMYVRGLGARIDHPVMGLYVDGIPFFNKNNFDFDFCDIRSVTVLRGPQGTLFGRNALGGVIDINTLSPFVYQGTRLRAEAGSGNTWSGQFSLYRLTEDSLGVSVNLFYKYTDGFYTNNYDNRSCDRQNSAGLRTRIQKRLSGVAELDNTFSVSALVQKGYPYRLLNDSTEKLNPVNYNDECSYRRLNISDGLSLEYDIGDYRLSQVTAYQYTHDRMQMDQDFLPESYFTLRQEQNDHVLSEELILKPREKQIYWNRLTGVMAFGRRLNMEAPVTFKEDGIDRLILSNANNGIQTMFPNAEIRFRENCFAIEDDFVTWTAGAAFFHNSTLKTGRWIWEAGLRLETEKSWFDYRSSSLIHYLFTYNMTEYRALNTLLEGKESLSSVEWLPRLSVTYRAERWQTYLSMAKGYKSGGFNTQLFSDILQQAMMNGLMGSMGLSMPGTGQTAGEVIRYKPEYNWNYEWGVCYAYKVFRIEALFFFMNCRDQQLTVFPEGTQTGRMMTNAGRTRNYGTEFSLGYTQESWRIYANWGYTNALFRSFVSGGKNYRGNYLPYVPQHTVSMGGEYSFLLDKPWLDKLTLTAGWRGFGPIYWDEENSCKQNFYALWDGGVHFQKGGMNIEVWCRNVTDTGYDVFYFVSMQNRFMQRGKPRRMGVSLRYEF